MNLKNDNEFENLFRRAADNFPLNTSGSNWESVLAKLEEKEEKKAFILINKKLLIVLLCTLFVVSITTLALFIVSKSNAKMVNGLSVKGSNESETSKTLENNIGAAVYKKIMDSLKSQQPTSSISNSNGYKTVVNSYPTNKHLVKSNKLVNSQFISGVNKNLVKNKTTQFFDNQIVAVNNEIKNTSTANTLNVDTISQETAVNTTASIISTVKDSNGFILKINDTTSVVKSVSVTKNKQNKVKYFYTGLLYATDKSSLKFEQNRGQGYSWAIVLGYQMSRLFSIESGLHIEKKEYYTTGENFNKSILLATGKINWIEAENKLLEIPITLKYNFYTKQPHQFFVTLGLSSYLINNEFYEYEEEVGGVLQDGSVLYQKNTSNLFATYNFSIGYQLNVKKIGNFRIEPYINLPLKGIGQSQTSIISRGVYLGWIYNFKK